MNATHDTSDMVIAPGASNSDLFIGKSETRPTIDTGHLVYWNNINLNSTATTNAGTFTSTGKITGNGAIDTTTLIATSSVKTNLLQSTDMGAKISLSGNSGGVIDLQAGTILQKGSTTITSDENLKNIISNVDLSVEDIADTRVVNYEFKSNPGVQKVGSIAQDWQNILPNAVSVIDEENHLGLDYSSTALAAAVIDAREIVKLKQENAELKERLAAIEAKLGI